MSFLLLLSVYCFILVKGINYPGGWIEPGHNTCINILNTTTTSDDNIPGVYDYLTLEHLYLPMFCHALEKGIDYTLSHRNVLLYPDGIRCLKTISSQFSIHGLWPNFIQGYPTGCQKNNTILPKQWTPSDDILLKDMYTVWNDPTSVSAHDMLCGLYNHEWQKHGTCYSTSEDSRYYFEQTLHIAKHIHPFILQIEKWIQENQKIIMVDSIKSLFSPFQINLFCDASNHLISLQTCWSRPPHHQISCPTPYVPSFLHLCDPKQSLHFIRYTPYLNKNLNII